MSKGFKAQIKILEALTRKGKVEVETLEETGRWFKKNYQTTPPTAVTVLKDSVEDERNLKTVWFNFEITIEPIYSGKKERSVFEIFICLMKEWNRTTSNAKARTSKCLYETLPWVDGFRWSSKEIVAGLRFKTAGGAEIRGGNPTVEDATQGELSVRWPTTSPPGAILLKFTERTLSITTEGFVGKPWYLELSNKPDFSLPFKSTTSKTSFCDFKNNRYRVTAVEGEFQTDPKAGMSGLKVSPQKGRVVLGFSERHSTDSMQKK